MSVMLYRLAGIGLACVLVTPASAQLLARKDLSANMALTIAQTTMATCTANGYRVSVTVVGRNGEVHRPGARRRHRAAHHGEQLPEGLHARAPSAFLGRHGQAHAEASEPAGSRHISPASPPAQGALPIKVGEDVIGAVGASGAPGGEKDEACVKAGIDKVADQLK